MTRPDVRLDFGAGRARHDISVGARHRAKRDLARVALALLLAAMAAGQLSDVRGFVDIMATYRVGGTVGATLLAALLIAGELSAAIGLLWLGGHRRLLAAAVALGVAIAWTLLAAQAFARGLVLDNCGCFGVHAAQSLRWWVLLEDVEFVALAWWIRVRSGKSLLARSVRGDSERSVVS